VQDGPVQGAADALTSPGSKLESEDGRGGNSNSPAINRFRGGMESLFASD